jgi:hypothetical protein
MSIERTAAGFILIAPNGLLDFTSMSASRGAAQYRVVGTPGEDGRLHTWGWWRQRGWRCRECEVMIISPETTTED